MKTTVEDKVIEDGLDLPEIYSRRELNALYREIPLKDTTSRQLRKYFNAMARLYGVIPLRKAYEIVSEQCPKLVTKEEFFAFAEIARHECEDFCIFKDTEIYANVTMTGRLDWKLVDLELLIGSFDEVSNTDEGQQGKPWYIPPKNELLAYKDRDYWEPTPQAVRLRTFLGQELHMGEENVETAFDAILVFTRVFDGSLETIMRILEDGNAVFSSRRTLEEFLAVYQDFFNNTRMQINRGYTPMELNAMMSTGERFPQTIGFTPNIQKRPTDGITGSAKIGRDTINVKVPDEAAKPRKVGRNDPCPCGSGKKYKKCCGR